jgi:hypothetical protein
MAQQLLVRTSIPGSAAKRALRIMLDWCRALTAPQVYRPEAYYMRGPGPRWREKHAQRPDSGLIS